MARNWLDEVGRREAQTRSDAAIRRAVRKRNWYGQTVPARDLGAGGDVVNQRRERPGDNLPPRGSQTEHADAARPGVQTVPRSIGGHVRPVPVVKKRTDVRGG